MSEIESQKYCLGLPIYSDDGNDTEVDPDWIGFPTRDEAVAFRVEVEKLAASRGLRIR